MHRLPVDGFYLKRCKVTRFLRIMKPFLPFYRRRAARKQYFCRFIVVARRGNNIFAVLSSPCSAGTIFLPFYRRRAARKQYFCHFIVAVQRGNNIFAILSSPCGAGTILLPFYRRRAAQKQYFCHFIVAVQRGNDILIIGYGADTIPKCWVVFAARIIYNVFTYAKTISSTTVIRSYRSSPIVTVCIHADNI